MNFSIPVYQIKSARSVRWITTGLGGGRTLEASARSATKAQRKLTDALRKAIGQCDPAEVRAFCVAAPCRLERTRIELTVRTEGRRYSVAGLFPLIVMPRWLDEANQVRIAFHPLRQDDWFVVRDDQPLDQLARLFLQHSCQGMSEDEVRDLRSDGRDRLRTISFAAQPKTLLAKLPDAQPKPRAGRGRKQRQGGNRILSEVGVDLTQTAIEELLGIGFPREPYRSRLQLLLAGRRSQPTLVVGPPQSGKTTLLRRLVDDLLEADGFRAHRNADTVRHVWLVNANRLIAGMSYLGDWEQRVGDLIADTSHHRRLLWLEDLHLCGQLGRHRESDNNFAQLLRGPVERGELTIMAECTPEQLQRLEDDAPSLARLFQRIYVEPTSTRETLAIVTAAARDLETRESLSFAPELFPTLLQLTAHLYPQLAFPGKALRTLRALAQLSDEPERVIGVSQLLGELGRRTGLPTALLDLTTAVDIDRLRMRLERRVIGQPHAVDAVCQLVERLAAGLNDASRPSGVFLFCGPTGTGKTELARALAEYLYDSSSRLLRFDMGEYGDVDAVPRLIGDRHGGRGLLTEAIRQQPFCVLLLDEIEKADPSVFNVLLQLLDDGRLTDAAGDLADFTHAVVVLTSNLGTRNRDAGFFEQSADAIVSSEAAVRQFFAPEFFNRLDRLLVFSPLTAEVAGQIVEKELGLLLARRGLVERNVFASPTAALIAHVLERGFDASLGARTVKRYLGATIGVRLASHLSDREPARLELLHISADAAGDIHLHSDALREAPTRKPQDAPALQRLRDLPPADIQSQLSTAAGTLSELLEAETPHSLDGLIATAMATTRDTGTLPDAEQIYWLDRLRGALRGVRGRAAFLARRKGAVRDELIQTLAQATLLRRCASHVTRAQHHAVVELLPVGLLADAAPLRQAGSGFIEQLLRSLLDEHLELDEYLLSRRDQLQTGESSSELFRQLELGACDQLLLRVSGLFVTQLLAPEVGCQLSESPQGGAQLLRVTLLDDRAHVPLEERWREIRAAHDAFLAQLDRGAPRLPENPRRLAPLVRRYHQRPAIGLAGKLELSVRDFRLDYEGTFGALSIAEAATQLRQLWLIGANEAQLTLSTGAHDES
jgi:ATP-dependent Clp protease ATP-binding subunit ClpC